MYIVDFTYDDRTLSSIGCGVGSLSTSNNENPTMGSELTFDTWTNTTSWKQGVVEAKYETPLTFTFDIVKMNCDDMNNYTFTEDEIRDIMRWLNQTTYKKFTPIFNDGSYDGLYFKGTFTNIVAMHMVGEVVGFTLTFTSNSPFGYIDKHYTGGVKKNIMPYPYFDGMEKYDRGVTYTVNDDHSISVKGETYNSNYTIIDKSQNFTLKANETYTFSTPGNWGQYDEVLDKLLITYWHPDGYSWHESVIYKPGLIKIPSVKGANTQISLVLNSISSYEFERDINFTFTPSIIEGEPSSFVINDNSDSSTGYIYPSKITIKCLEDGDFDITNSAEKTTCTIKNCVANEIIIMDCEHKVITSNKAHPNLYDDFNYNYPKIYCNKENEYGFSMACDVAIDYSEIRKVGIMA